MNIFDVLGNGHIVFGDEDRGIIVAYNGKTTFNLYVSSATGLSWYLRRTFTVTNATFETASDITHEWLALDSDETNDSELTYEAWYRAAVISYGRPLPFLRAYAAWLDGVDPTEMGSES